MQFLGCAYYPEYWGVDRINIDAPLMREAGINVVRIGEFAWSRLEPSEGEFTFDWLHQSLQALQRHGLKVLLCTPTATPPAWLVRKHPEMLLQREDGTRMRHGMRRHYCLTSKVYRRHVERIAGEMAKQTREYTNILGWQIDNELGPESGRCYCESCQQGFRDWLKDRYGSIEGVNRAWATGFWSEDNFEWSDIRFHIDRHTVAPSRAIDMLRFLSEAWVAFAVHQRDVIRSWQPESLVTTNSMGMPLYPDLDQWRLFEDSLDVACNDAYFDINPMANGAAAHDLFRSYKSGRAHWITETGCGALNHGRPPKADQYRAWMWCSIAHGADAWMVFRWRSCLSGQEQELQGILEHSGHPGHRFRAVKDSFAEVIRLMPELKALPAPDAPVSILNDLDSHRLYMASRTGTDIDSDPMPIYRQLWSRAAGVRFQRPGIPIEPGVRLLVIRNQPLADEAQARLLESFVEQGGTVLVIGQLAMRDSCGNYLPEFGPGYLRKSVGVDCVGGMYLIGGAGPNAGIALEMREHTPVGLSGTLAGVSFSGKADRWIGDLQATTATVLARFTEEAYAGQPALTEQEYGKGRFIWFAVGACSDALLGQVTEYALTRSGVSWRPRLPEHVEIQRRGSWLFVLNHSDFAQTVQVGAEGVVILGDRQGDITRMPPYGVTIIDLGRGASS